MFKPKNEKSQWRMIYEAIQPLGAGDIITYDDLDRVLGEESRFCRGAIYRASKELMKKDHRGLVSKRGEGYMVIKGMDMKDDAQDKTDRAGRLVVRAGFEARAIDVRDLSPEEKKTLDDFLVQNRTISEAIYGRIRRIEVATQYSAMAAEQSQMASAFSVEELEKLKEMLKTK